jgi:hypothetical protein
MISIFLSSFSPVAFAAECRECGEFGEKLLLKSYEVDLSSEQGQDKLLNECFRQVDRLEELDRGTECSVNWRSVELQLGWLKEGLPKHGKYLQKCSDRIAQKVTKKKASSTSVIQTDAVNPATRVDITRKTAESEKGDIEVVLETPASLINSAAATTGRPNPMQQ